MTNFYDHVCIAHIQKFPLPLRLPLLASSINTLIDGFRQIRSYWTNALVCFGRTTREALPRVVQNRRRRGRSRTEDRWGRCWNRRSVSLDRHRRFTHQALSVVDHIYLGSWCEPHPFLWLQKGSRNKHTWLTVWAFEKHRLSLSLTGVYHPKGRPKEPKTSTQRQWHHFRTIQPAKHCLPPPEHYWPQIPLYSSGNRWIQPITFPKRLRAQGVCHWEMVKHG